MIVAYVHLAYTMWLLWNKPFENRGKNTIEMFNESLALYLLYFLRMLCDRAASEATRNAVSYAMVGLAMVILVVNMVVITQGLVKEMLLRAKRKQRVKVLQKKIEIRQIAKAQQEKGKLEGSELPAKLVKIKCLTPRRINSA